MELTEAIWRKINFNGKEVELYIEVHTEPEYETPDFDYGNAEENKKEMKRFESGELENVCIRVQASLNQVTGSDYLGQCFVTDKNFKADVLSIVEDHGMIENAIQECMTRLQSLVDKVS